MGGIIGYIPGKGEREYENKSMLSMQTGQAVI